MENPATTANKKRRRLLAALGIFLLIALLLTLFSSGIEEFLYPEVTVTYVLPGTDYLTRIATAVAQIGYRETKTVVAPEEGMCLSGGKGVGEYVSAGEIAVVLLRPDNSTVSVASPVNGTLSAVAAKPYADYAAGDPLFEVAPAGSGLQAAFELESDYVTSLGGALTSAKIFQRSAQNPDRSYPFSEIEPNPASGTIRYSVELPENEGYIVGQSAVANFTVIVRESIGQAVISKDMVFDVTDGMYRTGTVYTIEQVNTLFGTRYCASAQTISITGSNACYYSYSAGSLPSGVYIASSSKPLYDGAYVRLARGE